MERHIDYLSFQAGGKMTVPFEAFLIFSTNLRPDSWATKRSCAAFNTKCSCAVRARRNSFEIFERFAVSRELECPPGLTEAFVEKHYVEGGKRFRRCHPRDVITHAIDILHFESLPMELNEDVLDRAF